MTAMANAYLVARLTERMATLTSFADPISTTKDTKNTKFDARSVRQGNQRNRISRLPRQGLHFRIIDFKYETSVSKPLEGGFPQMRQKFAELWNDRGLGRQ
jgi:hypothetical protein